MADTHLPPEFGEAGVRQGRAQAPESITYEWIRAEAERLERILRMQYAEPDEPATGEEKLPPQAEAGLARHPIGETTTTALRRWAFLKHLYLVRSERLVQAGDSDTAKEAARALLRRDPIKVELSTGRVVHVTARSYAATYAIAQHWSRLQILDGEAEDIAEKLDAVHHRIRSTRPWTRARRRLQKLAERLEETHRRAYMELAAQRQAIYAHAFTESGAPAESLEQAPEWWVEVDTADDAVLLEGIARAGPGRWQEVERALEPEKRKRAHKRNEKPAAWQDGWGSLFASIEREVGLEPATLYDRDLYQLRAWVAQLTTPEKDDTHDA